VSVITRESYREKRVADFVRYVGNFRNIEGLEIGALDFPTFRQGVSPIKYADSLSYEELLEKYGGSSIFDIREIVRPDYVARNLNDYARIQERFDYIIACHVIEHLPNPFGFTRQMIDLLKPGGSLFLAVPDKRFIAEDYARENTSLTHLLTDFAENPQTLTFDHYFDYMFGLEFDKAKDLAALIEKSKSLFRSGTLDIHCHVWTDQSFRQQIEFTTKHGWIQCAIIMSGLTPVGYNEFTVVLRKH
jgi:predicted SAM-dependent methyltransferase